MGLVLRIEAAPPEAGGLAGPGQLLRPPQGIRIGRAADNDLVLPDATRLVSKRHCEIAPAKGCFLLTDHSANGTFLNADTERLARDVPVVIALGDVIRIGDWRIAVVSTEQVEHGTPGDQEGPLSAALGQAPEAIGGAQVPEGDAPDLPGHTRLSWAASPAWQPDGTEPAGEDKSDLGAPEWDSPAPGGPAMLASGLPRTGPGEAVWTPLGNNRAARRDAGAILPGTDDPLAHPDFGQDAPFRNMQASRRPDVTDFANLPRHIGQDDDPMADWDEAAAPRHPKASLLDELEDDPQALRPPGFGAGAARATTRPDHASELQGVFIQPRSSNEPIPEHFDLLTEVLGHRGGAGPVPAHAGLLTGLETASGSAATAPLDSPLAAKDVPASPASGTGPPVAMATPAPAVDPGGSPPVSGGGPAVALPLDSFLESGRSPADSPPEASISVPAEAEPPRLLRTGESGSTGLPEARLEAMPEDAAPGTASAPGNASDIATLHPAKSAPAPDAPAAEADRIAVAAFLEACGIVGGTDAAQEPGKLLAQAGAIINRAVTGLHGLLSLRRMAKHEFGFERTMIGRSDNNPLKFVERAREALPLLLGMQTPGFMAGDTAIDEAFEDIRSHQMAMLAAMQAALAKVCDQLDPDTIEAAVPSRTWRLRRGNVAEARWAAYRQAYADVATGLDGDMVELFGADFVRAYREGGQRARPETAREGGDAK